MSYREENGQVVLTMSREDWKFLDFLIKREGWAYLPEKTCALLNRLNEGNPNYMPYQVEKS